MGRDEYYDDEWDNLQVSIHAPRVGRDVQYFNTAFGYACFNPRAPCGARHWMRTATQQLYCFNPRAPCGARRSVYFSGSRLTKFQSTRPVRGATAGACSPQPDGRFQSTRPVWGATVAHEFGEHGIDVSIHAPRVGRDYACVKCFIFGGVSIHAPHAGRDLMPSSAAILRMVSIHAPHAGRDPPVVDVLPVQVTFQSTRPMRGATSRCAAVCGCSQGFNPRAPCGARLRVTVFHF